MLLSMFTYDISSFQDQTQLSLDNLHGFLNPDPQFYFASKISALLYELVLVISSLVRTEKIRLMKTVSSLHYLDCIQTTCK